MHGDLVSYKFYNDCGMNHNEMDRQVTEDQHCSSCGQRDSCASIYQKLGESTGPSVLGKSIIAFVLPVVLFVAGLLVMRQILKGAVQDIDKQYVYGIVPALVLSAVGVGLARRIFLKGQTSGRDCVNQGDQSSKPKAE